MIHRLWTRSASRGFILLAVSLSAACGGNGGGGQMTPAPPVVFDSAGSAVLADPRGLAVADFNGDGRPDVASVSSTGLYVGVFLNSGAPGGNPALGPGAAFGTVLDPAAVAAADFNGDGRPDLAVVNRGSDSVSLYSNTTAPGASTAAFSGKVDVATGTEPVCVVAADVNLDGLVDLVIANFGGFSLSVLRNTTAPGAAVPSFASKVDFATAPNCDSIVIADLQGDGLPDLVIASSNMSYVSVLSNTTAPGSTALAFSGKVDFAAPAGAFDVVAFDANFDGRPDIAIVDLQSASVCVYRNTSPAGASPPTFATRADFPIGDEVESISSADFDGDGRPDLAIASQIRGVSILLNRTSPGSSTLDFTLRTDLGGGGARALARGDFNLDGLMDVVFLNSASIQIYRNQTSRPPATASFVQKTIGYDLINSRLADFDGDGLLDVAGIVPYGVGGAAGAVLVARNTTPAGAAIPTFAGGSSAYPTGTDPAPICLTIGDFNVDCKPDIAVVNFNLGNVSVFLNTTPSGSPTIAFAARGDFATGATPKGVAAHDLNGDGRPDLVVANEGSDSVSVLINTTGPGSTTPQFAGSVDFAVATNPRGVALADVNGDGRTDVVATNGGSASVSVFLNTTSAGATIPTLAPRLDIATGGQPHGVAIGDLNQDGRPDLAVANESSSTVTVLVNTTATGASAASFTTRSDFPTSLVPHWVELADLTGDGKLDLVVGTRGLFCTSVLLNIGVTGFPVPEFASKTDIGGNLGDEVGVGDMNGDGKPDIVTSSNFGHFDVLVQQ